jgi:hypothetical protein
MRSKIQETGCDVICIQETKREMFDQAFIKKIAQRLLTASALFLQ